MRHTTLALPAPAYRARLFAAHGRRSREARSLLERHFAIERLARNRSQTPESCKRSQFPWLAGIPQRVVGEAIGARNRNERYQTSSTGLTLRSLVIQDPRRAKCKKKIRSGGVRWILGASRLVALPNLRNSSGGIPGTTILHNVTSGGMHPPYEPRR